ncbi:LacI family DNA-binding transcriptional regulator [Streptobacillus moniliformis]|uniref:LacI family DNA-binding transcriptional regulator n=1 Tax=Streptobacillus moniliformis TaxID=34105 RepID=UPI0009BF74A3|nr:LacI family DNA-binding transcriptional regulator [Streptobacillus moniliformis]
MKKIRLKDIAELASVSATTVSLVLNDKKTRISKEKKEEIKKIASELNYQPNIIARSLAQKKTFTIGLIIPDINNPFFSSLSKYIEETLYKEGYLLLIANSNNSTEHEKLLIQSYINHQVDGILLCPSNEMLDNYDYEKYLENLPVPIIIIDRIMKNSHITQISYDNKMGGYLATKYLIENGCKNIACVTGTFTSQSSKDRLIGYKKALKESNINNQYIFKGDFTFESGLNLAPDIIKTSPEGIFFFNDMMAYGFFYYLKKHNIPENKFLICGYDNLQLSEMFHLTSIEQNTEILSTKCCKSILDIINNQKVKKREILKPKLIVTNK